MEGGRGWVCKGLRSPGRGTRRQLAHADTCCCCPPGPLAAPQAGRKIVWSELPFWKQRFCPQHDSDGTPRCAGCARLQLAGEQHAELEDGRHLCLECLATACIDTREALPLWHSVLRCAADYVCPGPAITVARSAPSTAVLAQRAPPTLPACPARSFFASLGMGLPSTPPMMLVDGSALQEVRARVQGQC